MTEVVIDKKRTFVIPPTWWRSMTGSGYKTSKGNARMKERQQQRCHDVSRWVGLVVIGELVDGMLVAASRIERHCYTMHDRR